MTLDILTKKSTGVIKKEAVKGKELLDSFIKYFTV